MCVVTTASAFLLALALCYGQDITRWSRPIDDRTTGDWIPLTNDQLGQASARALAQPLTQQNTLFGQPGNFGQQPLSADTGKYIGNAGGYSSQEFLQSRFQTNILPQQLPPQFLNQQFGSAFTSPYNLGQSLLRAPFIGQTDQFIPPPLPPPPPPPPHSLQIPPLDQPLSSNLKPNENYYNQDSGRPFDQIDTVQSKQLLPKRPNISQQQSEIGSYKGKEDGNEKEEVQILYIPVETLKNQRGRGGKGTLQQDHRRPPIVGVPIYKTNSPSNYDADKSIQPNFPINKNVQPIVGAGQQAPTNVNIDQRLPSNYDLDEKFNSEFKMSQKTPTNLRVYELHPISSNPFTPSQSSQMSKEKPKEKFRHPIQPLPNQQPALHLQNFSAINPLNELVKMKMTTYANTDYDNQKENAQQIASSPVVRNVLPDTTSHSHASETQQYFQQSTRFSNVKAHEKEPDEFYNPQFSKYVTESKGTPTTRIPHYQTQDNFNIGDYNTRVLPPPNQPPLSVYMETSANHKIGDVLSLLKDAKTIPVLDTIGPDSPQVFVGPSSLKPPHGYVKFELPYLSSLDGNKVERKVLQLPFFVAPLNFEPPPGYSKIPFPPPHIGSVVLSNNSPKALEHESPPTPQTPHATSPGNSYTIPAEISSISPQLPSLINNLQVDQKFSGLSTPQDILEETTVAPGITDRPNNRPRRPLHRGGQRHSHLQSESEVSTTRKPTRQRRPFTSRNMVRHTTPLTTITTSSTEKYQQPINNIYNEKQLIKPSIEDYNLQQHNDGFAGKLESDPIKGKPIENAYTSSDNTKSSLENTRQIVSHFNDEQNKEMHKYPFSDDGYKTGNSNGISTIQTHNQEQLKSTSYESDHDGNSFSSDYQFGHQPDSHNRPHQYKGTIRDYLATNTESSASEVLNDSNFNHNNVRADLNEYAKIPKFHQSTPHTFIDGSDNEDESNKYYTQRPSPMENHTVRRPVAPKEQETPGPTDFATNPRIPVSLSSQNEETTAQRPQPVKDHPKLDQRLISENEQYDDNSSPRFSPEQDYYMQYQHSNSQSNSGITKRPDRFEPSYYDTTDQHHEDYITTESNLKSLLQPTVSGRDPITYTGRGKDATLNQEDDKYHLEHTSYKSVGQNLPIKFDDEEREPPTTLTTNSYYNVERTTPKTTERSHTRVRGRLRGRGSYTSRVKTTTEAPNYPVHFGKEEKEETHGYKSVKIDSTGESNEPDDDKQTITEPTNRSSISNGNARTASRRPLRTSHRASQVPTTSIPATSTPPSGVKYLIRTRRPQSIQTKLSTGRSRIRKPTVAATTEIATETPQLYNTEYPPSPNQGDHNSRIKHYTQPVSRGAQVQTPSQSKIEGDTDSEVYKPVTSSFDPNIKFIHNVRSSTASYKSDENVSDYTDEYAAIRNSQNDRNPVYSKPRPYVQPKKINHPPIKQEEVRINVKQYETTKQTTRPFQEDFIETTKKPISHTTDYITESYQTEKGGATPDYEEEVVTLKHYSPKRGQSHRFRETDSTQHSERLNNHRHGDYQLKELTKSEKQKQAEDFWNQAVTIQQSKSYEYEPDSPVFSTPSSIPKASKIEYDYEDYFNVPENEKYDKAVSDQSPLPSNDQQVTYTGLKPQVNSGKDNQYPEKSTTSSYEVKHEHTYQEYSDIEKDDNENESQTPINMQTEMSSRSDTDVRLDTTTEEIDINATTKKPGRRRGTWVRVKVKKLRDVFETAESQSFGSLSSNDIQTVEKGKPVHPNYSDAPLKEGVSQSTDAITIKGNVNNDEPSSNKNPSSTHATTNFFNTEGQTETPFSTTAVFTEAAIPDTTTLDMDSSTLKALSSVPEWESKVLGTSTTTEISLETEICYRGRCVKTKRAQNKPIDTSDLITTD